MFEIIVAVIQIAMLFSFYFAIPTLLVLRCIIAIKSRKSFINIIKITLIPFSMGYFYYLSYEEKKKYYKTTLLTFSIMTIIGILFTFFQVIVPGI